MNNFRLIKILILLLPVLSLGIATARSENPDKQLERMKVDYRKWISTMEKDDFLVEFNPAADAIGIKDPRFSWVVRLDGQGRMQTAYQIQVASSPELLTSGQPDLWDSGLVSTEKSTQITYGGHPLHSNSDYFWRVRV